jgi:hypothetical protein
LLTQERQYFDSADNAMVAAGMRSAEGTGHIIATTQTVAAKKKAPLRPSAMVSPSNHTSRQCSGLDDERKK